MISSIKDTLFSPEWLNNNQGLLALASLLVALLPFIGQIITLQQLWKWRDEQNAISQDIAESTFLTGMNLFRSRVDLKKYITDFEQGIIYARPKLLRTYPLKYAIDHKFTQEKPVFYTVKMNLLCILEYIDLINHEQSIICLDKDNTNLQKQMINEMKYVLEKIEETLKIIEIEFRKKETDIKEWTFSKDPSFLKVFSTEELTL